MVDVAAILTDVFGAEKSEQRPSEKGCVQCVSVSEAAKPLEHRDIVDTVSEHAGHTFQKGVSEPAKKCVREGEQNQHVTAPNTKTHQTHLKFEAPPRVDLGAFEERAAIAEHDGEQPRQDAEALAAREHGFEDASDLHRAAVGRWAAEIDRLAQLGGIGPEATEAIRRAQTFIAEGWALQTARLGWDELDLLGVCPRAPWARLDRKGAAFRGAVQAVTREAIVYVDGLRRYRANINNDGGAVPIWDLAKGDSELNGGSAA